jgi:excinuclease ABC subunit A
VRWNGKNIDEVLGLSVTEACLFFAGRPEITKRLYPLVEVGLGYLKLGQPTTTLSGGELQRIKLAYHLVHEKGRKILYLFDEPTIGLHPNDIAVLLRSFQKLVGGQLGRHRAQPDVIKSADHVNDRPEGGGGHRVVAQWDAHRWLRPRILTASI